MAVLLTGGAGYIGSHCAKLLKKAGEEVLLLDDLRTGHVSLAVAPLVKAATTDARALDDLFAAHSIDAVMHFAAYIEVGESVQNPAKYYENNFGGSVALVQAMIRHGVGRLVFSSTAAVYGEPREVPIPETHPTEPVNPYGRSKRMVEQLLADCGQAHGLRSVSLRYFNAAGADPEGEIGERHQPESHLIPRLMEIIYSGKASLPVYGNDYDTPDGTCVRDYIHVNDLADAHLLALRHLRATQAEPAWSGTRPGRGPGYAGGGASDIFNLGSEHGYSVLEVLNAAERITCRPAPREFRPRRAGDSARLIASSAKIRRELGWQPQYGLDDIIATAWAWRQKLGPGFQVRW